VLISSAFAQAPAPAGDAGLMGFLPIILMFVLLYFLMIRPQMKRAKEHKAMVDALQKGDEVVAAGGVLGRITRVTEAYVSVEIAANVEISVQKGAVQTLLPKGTLKSVQ
jgi:preprotein translocase subunit YajC